MNKLLKSKKNIDYLELVFNYDPNQMDKLNKMEDLIVDGKLNPKTNKWTYEINGIFSITEAPPKGIIEGRTYVKILNPKLYDDKLWTLIKFLKSILSIEYIGINRIDFCIDIKDEDILETIDFNKLDEYKANKGIFLQGETNDEGGKSLYFNTINLNKQKRKSVFKKQRVSAILYTKSNLLNRGCKSKKEYQNENDELLTRLELRLMRTPQETKDTHLIKTLSYYLWNDPLYLKRHQETITQWIFNYYRDIYKLETITNPILNYNNLYDEDDDFNLIYINDFIDDFNNIRADFNIRHREYKITKTTTHLNKRLYSKKLGAFIDLSGERWSDYINDNIILEILKETGVKSTIELEYIKVKEGNLINGRNIFREIHDYIMVKSKTLLKSIEDDFIYKPILDDDYTNLF